MRVAPATAERYRSHPEGSGVRQMAHAMRMHAVEHLDSLLPRLADGIAARGGDVFFAADAVLRRGHRVFTLDLALLVILLINRSALVPMAVVGVAARVTARLTDVKDGFTLWSDSYARELGDLFTVQDEIARKVAEKLGMEVAPGELPTANTVDPEAYNLMLMGRHLVYERSQDSDDRAIDCLRRAVEIMPGYVAAWIELGRLRGLPHG